ncbi:unnamed protein product [Lupinus luteus]|uniref:Uncharacterized protein n=1 Tax=Lupinus luteus TaxID=3873 RepID=A0AAV1X5T5_LUPLU
MRWTMQVFRVVKDGGSAYVMRLVGRLWPESEDIKTSRGNEGDEMLKKPKKHKYSPLSLAR